MLNANESLLDQLKAFIGVQEFGGGAPVEQWQRRSKPMRRLTLITEDGDGMGDNRHDPDDEGVRGHGCFDYSLSSAGLRCFN